MNEAAVEEKHLYVLSLVDLTQMYIINLGVLKLLQFNIVFSFILCRVILYMNTKLVYIFNFLFIFKLIAQHKMSKRIITIFLFHIKYIEI